MASYGLRLDDAVGLPISLQWSYRRYNAVQRGSSVQRSTCANHGSWYAIDARMNSQLDLRQALQRMEEARNGLAVIQEELSARRFSASAVEGAVTAVVSGALVLVELEISPEAAALSDLSQRVLAALQEASTAAARARYELVSAVTANLAMIRSTDLSAGQE